MKSNTLRRAWRWLTRTDVAALLIVLLMLVTAIGSFFPQLAPAIADDAARLARWETAVRARYGALTDLLAAIGVFHFFSSLLFLLPLALLSVATLACTLNRLPSTWKSLLRERLPLLLSLLGHVTVLLLLLGVVSSGSGWREELTIRSGDTVQLSHAREIALRNEGFTIARYANGSPANYEARIIVLENGQETKQVIRLNEPLEYRSVGFYLYAYNPTERGYAVTLLAVHDPGYGLVIVAGFLFLLTMTARLAIKLEC